APGGRRRRSNLTEVSRRSSPSRRAPCRSSGFEVGCSRFDVTEMTMPPNSAPPLVHFMPDRMMKRFMGSLSLFTLLMTIPQVLAIWIGRQAAGVSLLSWSAYLLSALLWFWYGLRRRDQNIYLPCIGWMALDI